MTKEHPFSDYVRTLGRGPARSRPLTREDARDARGRVLSEQADPLQVGAFLLLLRYRSENAAELAGFVEAGRERLAGPARPIAIDLDWPSYADRHRQQPYFVLAALLLADSGLRILMHGIAGDNEGHAPTRPVLAALGVPISRSLDEAAGRIVVSNFAYIGLEDACAAVERLFHLRSLLGVRTVANSFARALNPLGAPAQLQAVAHPPYRTLYQAAAALLGQPRAVVFKGIGGEVQRNPQKSCHVAWLRDGETGEAPWPALDDTRAYPWREENLDPARVVALWRGEIALPVPEAAIVATAAIGLWITGRADSQAEAEEMAAQMWAERDREKYGTATALSA